MRHHCSALALPLIAQSVTVILPHLLVSSPEDSFHALGQAPIQNLKFACDQTGRIQWDLKYTDIFTIPRLSWGLKPAAVAVFQLLVLV